MRAVVVALVALLSACAPQAPSVSADEVQTRYQAATQAYENDISEFERTAGAGEAFAGNLAPLADFLRSAMRQRSDENARARAAVYLATLPIYQTPLNEADYRDIVAAAPAASAEWNASPQNSSRFLAEGLPADEARSFFGAMARDNPEAQARAWALIRTAELERRAGNVDAYAAAYAELGAYAEVEGLRYPIRLLYPENKVRVGVQAPAFALRELGGDTVVTNEDFRGRYYLLDFWASWCAPCVTERPVITRAQERFGGDRFTVVSVSIDNRAEDAIAFRERRWPMNWPNLYAPGSHFGEDDFRIRGDIAEAYEINWIGVPQLVLVSPEGRVLALRDELDGAVLERTLSRHLGSPG